MGLWAEASFWVSGLGRIALLTGDYAQARAFYEQGGRLAAEHAIRFGEEYAEVGLGLVAREEGRLDAAEAHLRNWLDQDCQVDAHANAALILTELGFIAELRGDPRAVARALDGLAGAYALAGRHDHAARLLGALVG